MFTERVNRKGFFKFPKSDEWKIAVSNSMNVNLKLFR